MTDFEKRVYEIVRTIPYGQTRTYKQIAEKLGNAKLARAVGNALHKNPSLENAPCHRVVNSKGKLATNYGFGGKEGQKRLLEKEGVIIKDYKVL